MTFSSSTPSIVRATFNVALDSNEALEPIGLSLPPLGCSAAVRAVLGCDPAVPDVDGDAAERQLLAVGKSRIAA